MLITQLKDKEVLTSQLTGKVFILNCHGCKELYFPEKAVAELTAQLKEQGIVTGSLTTDYICNPENLALR